jgi:hypothetical protein
MIQAEAGVGVYNFEGSDRVCAYRSIDGSDGWTLGVVAVIDESPSKQVKYLFLLSGAVFIELGIVAAFFLFGKRSLNSENRFCL